MARNNLSEDVWNVRSKILKRIVRESECVLTNLSKNCVWSASILSGVFCLSSVEEGKSGSFWPTEQPKLCHRDSIHSVVVNYCVLCKQAKNIAWLSSGVPCPSDCDKTSVPV